jgi:hypothetical protein
MRVALGLLLTSCMLDDGLDDFHGHKHPFDPEVRSGAVDGWIAEEGGTVPERMPTPCLDAHDPGFFQVRQVDQGSFTRAPVASEPTTALVVFDKSGSMGSYWEPEDETDPDLYSSKWDAASGALVTAVTPLQDRLTLGAIFFPVPDECFVASIESERQVSFRAGPKFLDRWMEVTPWNTPDGGTPLMRGLFAAQNAIESACTKGMLDQRFIVIVLTDGEPNCDTDMETVLEMTATWLEHGIPTYVFGLPGSEGALGVLDAIAEAGGTETLIVPGGPDELADGMGAIL